MKSFAQQNLFLAECCDILLRNKKIQKGAHYENMNKNFIFTGEICRNGKMLKSIYKMYIRNLYGK